MQTLSALEIKRRGVIALEEALKNGPVHIIKNNRPRCVVLSEEDYAALLAKQNEPATNLWDLLNHRPWEGKRSKKDIDQQVNQERDDWKETMKIWQVDINIPALAARGKNTMVEYLGIEFIEIGDDFLVARMPVDNRTKQPVGIMHGGASCVLAESAGSTAANCCVDQAKYYCVGLDINTNHIRSVREGFVYAMAKPFHLGKTTQVWSIEITNEAKQLVSVNRLTMMVLTK